MESSGLLRAFAWARLAIAAGLLVAVPLATDGDAGPHAAILAAALCQRRDEARESLELGAVVAR